MTVDDMIDDIIRREGGYVDHPKDRGGPTKYGITQPTLDRWCQENGLRIYDVSKMPKATARKIYRVDYYQKPRIDQLPPAIQPFLFDCAVNHGPSRAVKFLQEALRELWHATVRVDGKIGPKTCEAAASALALHGEGEVLERLIARRRAFYFQIVDRDPSQKVFLKGWLNRLAEFEQEQEQEPDLAAQLTAAEARIAELEAALTEALDRWADGQPFCNEYADELERKEKGGREPAPTPSRRTTAQARIEELEGER